MKMDIIDDRILMAFDKLIKSYSKMYDICMNDLYVLEKENKINSKEFKKGIEKLRKLQNYEEARLLEKLSSDDLEVNLPSVFVMMQQASKGDTKKFEALQDRLEQVFYEKLEKEEMAREVIDNIYDYIDDDVEIDENTTIEVEIRTCDFTKPIKIDFLKYLQSIDKKDSFIKYKYYTGFVYPKIGEELLVFNYNVNGLQNNPLELEAKANNMEIEEYESEKEAALLGYAYESFANLFSLATDSEANLDELEIAYEEAKFTVIDQKTEILAEIYKEYFNDEDKYILTEQAIPLLNALSTDLMAELYARDDFDELLLEPDTTEEELSQKLEDDQREILFNLLSTINEINKHFSALCALDICGYKDDVAYQLVMDQLKELCKKEKKYAYELDLDLSDPMTAYHVITNIQNYFIGLYEMDLEKEVRVGANRNFDILIQRAINLIFEGQTDDYTIYRDSGIPHYIITNYELECLNKFEDHIYDSETPESYIEFKYCKILEDAYITEEFAIADGDISRALILGDEEVSAILELDPEEYAYDKEEMLSEHARDIIEYFEAVPKEYEPDAIDKASSEYQMICLDTALQYVSDESFEQIEEAYRMNDNEERSHLYKSLNKTFKKEDVKVLQLENKRH